MLGVNGRGIAKIVFTPIAKLLYKMGVAADAVTIFGSVITAIISFTCIATGKLILGLILLIVFAFFDSIDGTLARMSGKASRWGAFLDATCDRFSDFFILFGLTIYCYNRNAMFGTIMCILCMPVFFGISYTRAKAESLGFKGEGGLLERSDRLVALSIIILPTGLNVPIVYFNVTIIILFLGCVITIYQRMSRVFKQNKKGLKFDFSTQINTPIVNIKKK
jgi:CDP-diacylglycerol--glycerol-3-phosphate 3-phosphatidyltransferase